MEHASLNDEPEPDDGLAADLWRAGQSWNEDWQQRQAALPDVLYHYTDAAGLLGIVQSGQLWASHAAFLNDSTEISYVKRVLDRARGELTGQYDQPLVGEFLRQVDELFQRLVVSKYDVYLVCFCENGDQLSQWRGYPSTGGGYAIGFHRAVIADN
jgi:hypothetical protein